MRGAAGDGIVRRPARGTDTAFVSLRPPLKERYYHLIDKAEYQKIVSKSSQDFRAAARAIQFD